MVPALLLTYGCGSKESGHKKTAEVGWKDMLDNFRDWGIYRGDKGGNQYSELDQINAQYVVIVAGGGSRRAGPPISAGIGRTVHAFALPD